MASDDAAHLFDASPLERTADEVFAALRPGETVLVTGAPGTGRGVLTDLLAARLQHRAVVVDIPSGADVDAPLQVQLRAASAQGPEAVAAAVEARLPARERFLAAFQPLDDAGQVLLVRVPDDIRDPALDEDPNGDWVAALLEAVAPTSLQLVLMVPEREALRWRTLQRHHVTLRPCVARVDALQHAPLWGDYAAVAANLGRKLGATTLSINPLQLRLMVGLAGLGVPLSHVAPLARARPGDLSPFLRLLTQRLAQEELSEVRAGARRAALMRTAMPRDEALRLARPPEAHRALVEHCIGYGDGTVTLSAEVRRALLQALERGPDEAADHEAVAAHHQQLDGAPDPATARGVSPAALRHWLERVHHLALAGPRAAAAWRTLDLTSRELLIARARSLSIDYQDYEGAAALYAQCLQHWPNDAYAAHYRAFNLDQIGREPEAAERLFVQARAWDSQNLFYNSRLVTFLIGQGRFGEADEAWDEAMANLEHRRDKEVAYHVTLHVVQAWLDVGELARARHVFDQLPLGVEPGRAWRKVEQALLDAEEAEQLGVAVYPPDFPVGKRWRGARVAPERRSGKARVGWFPGRVVEAAAEQVVLAMAVPDPDPAARRAIVREVAADEWRRICDWAEPHEARGYVEVAHYEGEPSVVVFSVPTPAGPPSEAPAPHPLRYLLQRARDDDSAP